MTRVPGVNSPSTTLVGTPDLLVRCENSENARSIARALSAAVKKLDLGKVEIRELQSTQDLLEDLLEEAAVEGSDRLYRATARVYEALLGYAPDVQEPTA